MEKIGETSRGYWIYRQEEGHGGYSYWVDDIGGGRRVWDDGLDDEDILVEVLTLRFKLTYGYDYRGN